MTPPKRKKASKPKPLPESHPQRKARKPKRECICHQGFEGMAINCPKCNGGGGIIVTAQPLTPPSRLARFWAWLRQVWT